VTSCQLSRPPPEPPNDQRPNYSVLSKSHVAYRIAVCSFLCPHRTGWPRAPRFFSPHSVNQCHSSLRRPPCIRTNYFRCRCETWRNSNRPVSIDRFGSRASSRFAGGRRRFRLGAVGLEPHRYARRSRQSFLSGPSSFQLFLYFTVRLSYLVVFLSLFSPCPQDTERIVGCTGSPADSHDILWFRVTTEKTSRCPECGSGTCLVQPIVTMPTDMVS
jgi:hypothetical protein